MVVPGWDGKYAELAREFGYNKRLDYEAAVLLDSLVERTATDRQLEELLRSKTVFVAGAGPSLGRAVHTMKQFRDVPLVAADSAAGHLVSSGIVPDVITTDLDGGDEALLRCSALRTIFVVHAHGDNMHKLPLALHFGNRLGTAQSGRHGSVQNFGGFMDGDRAVFLASHFGAKNIVLFGMDYGGTVGRYSNTRRQDRALKLRKLARSQKLLTWLSKRTNSRLFTTSCAITGFERVGYGAVRRILG